MTDAILTVHDRRAEQDDAAMIHHLLATAGDDPDDGDPRSGVVNSFATKSNMSLAERRSRGLHLIGSIRFGDDRVTTCERCGFTCTGDTDEAMGRNWRRHVEATNGLGKKARGRGRSTERDAD